MDRREFLKLVGLTAAAASTAEIAALVPIPADAVLVAPAIGWEKWNAIELTLRSGEPRWCINGQCVNGHPELVRKVSQIVDIGGGTLSDCLQFGGSDIHFGYRERVERHAVTGHEGRVATYDLDGLLVKAALEKQRYLAEDPGVPPSAV